MSLNLPVGGSDNDFKRAPSGSHIAVCNMVVDCGLHPGSAQFPKPKRKLYIRFEIPAERIEYEVDGRKKEGPLTIGSFYTASMNSRCILRKHLEGWRGRSFTDEEAAAFDVSAIIGKACMLSVIENDSGGKTYSNIAGIGQIPKGIPAPPLENTPLVYLEGDPNKVYDKLPKWLQDKIDDQLDPPRAGANESHAGNDSSEFPDDDIPF